MHIVILDGYALNPGDLQWEPLTQLGTLDIYDRTAPSQLLERAENADIVITNKVCFDAHTLSQLPKLRCIVVTATGYNIIDTQSARQQGIIVCNAPAYSTPSVAQHVFALLLHICTHTADYAVANSQGRWSASPDFCYISHPTMELTGKAMGIAGVGNIGSQVAAIAHTFGMKVLALTSKQPSQLPSYVKPVSKEEMLQQSDVISLHCPLTSATELFINANAISLMKQGAIVINTSRGGLIDEQAVADALHSGRLAGFAADVLSTEPPAANNPLLHAPNAFTTPHIAWATLEARQRLMHITIENVRAFAEGSPINIVN